jgi:hypothetical protein
MDESLWASFIDVLYGHSSLILKYYAKEYEPNMNIGSKRCSCLGEEGV